LRRVAGRKFPALETPSPTSSLSCIGLVTTRAYRPCVIPSGALEMLGIPGLRPEKVLKIYRELGISSLDELETWTRSTGRTGAADSPCASARGLAVHALAHRDRRELLVGRLFLVEVGVEELDDVVVPEGFGPGD
jgi:hypothetical protein